MRRRVRRMACKRQIPFRIWKAWKNFRKDAVFDYSTNWFNWIHSILNEALIREVFQLKLCYLLILLPCGISSPNLLYFDSSLLLLLELSSQQPTSNLLLDNHCSLVQLSIILLKQLRLEIRVSHFLTCSSFKSSFSFRKTFVFPSWKSVSSPSAFLKSYS